MDKTTAFQSFDDRSDVATCAPRLAALCAELAKRGLDGFVIPHSDEYQSEYLPECNERLAWLTSFTGSAGAAVVLKDKAAVFVDGRYTLQVQQQTDTKLFEPRDLVEEGANRWRKSRRDIGADRRQSDRRRMDRPSRRADRESQAARHEPRRRERGSQADAHRRGREDAWRRRGGHQPRGFDLLAAQHSRRRHPAHALRTFFRNPECRRFDRSVHGRMQILTRIAQASGQRRARARSR